MRELYVMQVLNDFEVASSLKVNLRKSKVFCSKMFPASHKELIHFITSMNFCSNLRKHLGFSLIQMRVKKEDSHFLIDKMNSRLSAWKANLLKRASKLTLVNSILF